MPNMRPLEMPLLITAAPRTAPNHTALIPLVHSGSFILSLVMSSGMLQGLEKGHVVQLCLHPDTYSQHTWGACMFCPSIQGDW